MLEILHGVPGLGQLKMDNLEGDGALKVNCYEDMVKLRSLKVLLTAVLTLQQFPKV